MDTEEGSGDDNEDLTLYVTAEPLPEPVDIDDDNDDQENLFLEPQPSSVPVTSSGYYSPAQSMYGGYRGYRVPPPPPVPAQYGGYRVPVYPAPVYPLYYPRPPHYSMYPLYG